MGRFFSREASSGAQIREVENQIFDRIAFVFQRGGNGKTFAVWEKAKHEPAPRDAAVVVDHAQLSPRPCRRDGDWGRRAPLVFRATDTTRGAHFASGRVNEPAMVMIAMSQPPLR